MIPAHTHRLAVLPSISRRATPRALATAAILLVCLGALAVEAYGFRTAPLFSQLIWTAVGAQRFTRFIGMYLALALPLLLMAPWTFPALIVGLAAAGTAISVGPLPLVVVAFFLVSSCALGARLLGPDHDESPLSQLLATLLGIAAWIFLMTLSARLPVHYPAVWAALLAAPLLADPRGAWRRTMRWVDLLRRAKLHCGWERAAFGLLAFVLLAHWFAALTPETSADGLAMHLAIPANIAVHHAMTFEPSRFLWAVMPMGADFVYSIVYLLGGEYAAHLVDFALLLVLVAMLYYAMRRSVSRGTGLLLVALFATTPLVQLVTGSLFVENVLAAMVLGLMVSLWEFGETGERRYLCVAAALGGTALAVKFGAIAFVVLALPFLIYEAARHAKKLGRRSGAVAALAAVLLFSTAMPAYTIAWWKTNDPLFPFLHARIKSPLLSASAAFEDVRYAQPLTWATPFDLTFYSNQTYEGQNGSFGFQYLLLAPLAVVAIVFVRRRPVVSAGVVALGACVLIMKTQPNARYLYPALPLLFVPFAAILGWSSRQRWLRGVLLVFAVAATGLNLYFLPSAGWYHKDFCLRLPFSRNERQRYRDLAAPIRKVIEYLNRAHPGSAVLLTRDSSDAGIGGEVYENHWQQYNVKDRIHKTATVPDMLRLMQTWHVNFFITPKPGAGDLVSPFALRQFLESCTSVEFAAGDQYLARLDPACRPTVTVALPAGVYDDANPALFYSGDWTNGTGWEHAGHGTLSWSNDPGAEVGIVFEGVALTYTYTKALNRGLAEMTIDGASADTIDLYSPTVEWQASRRFCCFTPGQHTAELRVVGRANPKSTGTFIDLDSFTVEPAVKLH